MIEKLREGQNHCSPERAMKRVGRGSKGQAMLVLLKFLVFIVRTLRSNVLNMVKTE